MLAITILVLAVAALPPPAATVAVVAPVAHPQVAVIAPHVPAVAPAPAVIAEAVAAPAAVAPIAAPAPRSLLDRATFGYFGKTAPVDAPASAAPAAPAAAAVVAPAPAAAVDAPAAPAPRSLLNRATFGYLGKSAPAAEPPVAAAAAAEIAPVEGAAPAPKSFARKALEVSAIIGAAAIPGVLIASQKSSEANKVQAQTEDELAALRQEQQGSATPDTESATADAAAEDFGVPTTDAGTPPMAAAPVDAMAAAPLDASSEIPILP